MKRFLSLLLCAAILFAVPMYFSQDVDAANQYKMVLRLDSASDVTDFNHRNGSDKNALTADVANTTYTKLSTHSVPWVNHYDQGNCQFKWARNANFSIDGYNYLNIWAHSNESFKAKFRMVMPKPNDAGYYRETTIEFKPGWNLITMRFYSSTEPTTSFATLKTDGLTDVASVSFNADGKFGATEKQPYSSTRAVYFDSIFLTVNAPANNDFEAINIKEGADKVLTTTQTIKFKAPGLLESSLNVNNVTVKYCQEGTHDEANHSQATLSAGTDYTLGYEKDTLKVNFTNELIAGTTYNVHIGGAGFKGELALPFNTYDLSFRTLGADENIPPAVSLVDLEANTRFFPSDGAITLKAQASDSNGTIEKVEFYADETLLGEVTEAVEGIYAFTWENPLEDAGGYNIIAKAYDNDGDATETEPVSVLVLDLKNPEVALTAPTENVILSRNFAGIETNAGVTVSADVTCIGAIPSEVEFVMDGDTVHTATNVASSYSYTLTDLPLGDHQIYVRVTDEYGMQGVSEAVVVTVQDFGKQVPGLLEEDFETFAEGDEIAWTLSGEAVTLTAAIDGDNTVAKISSENAGADETVYMRKHYLASLSGTAWEAGLRVNFVDMNFDREVEIQGATEGLVLDFKTDGGVYVGAEKKADYRAGEWYNIKIIVDPEARTLNALLDETVVLTKTNLATSYSKSGAIIKVNQNVTAGKSGYILVDNVGIYQISETQVEATGITVYDGTTPAADLDNVPVSADKLTITLTEALGSSLKNNVWVIDTVDNRKLSLKFDENAVYFNEDLRGNREYQVIVTTGVSGVSGHAIAKNGVFTFTTAPKDGEISGATFSVPELSSSVSSITCELPFINHSGTEHNMQIVAIIYNGSAMQDIMIQPVTVSDSTPSDTLSVTVPVTSYTADTFIEVFVVDDLNNMTPISETIYTIQ